MAPRTNTGKRQLEEQQDAAARLAGLLDDLYETARRPHPLIRGRAVVRDDTGRPVIDPSPGLMAATRIIAAERLRSQILGYGAPPQTPIKALTEELVEEAIAQLEDEIRQEEHEAFNRTHGFET